ncbi:MAG: CehA/McbA family metallohydrolase [Sphingobium sp.]
MRSGLASTLFTGFLGLAAGQFSSVYAQDSEGRWYKGNTHTHTVNSDGDSSPDHVARWYKEHGYQFLFITDHGYVTDVAPLNALLGASGRFLIMPGEEITQSRRGEGRGNEAHVNALFTTKSIRPVGELECFTWGCVGRAAASVSLGSTIDANVATVRQQGGIAQVNHPNYLWSLKPEDLDALPDGSLLEIWNGIGETNNLGGGDGMGDKRPSGEGFWDHALSLGKVVWGVGADDSHWFQGERVADPASAGPGKAWIMVRASELTPTAIRTAISKGEFYASTGVSLADISADEKSFTITIAQGKDGSRYVTRFIGKGGKVLAEVDGVKPSYHFQGVEAYVRASIIDSNGRRAWTQPIFRDGR